MLDADYADDIVERETARREHQEQVRHQQELDAAAKKLKQQLEGNRR